MTPVWGWGEISPWKGSPLLAVSFCPFPSLAPPHPHTKGAWWKGQFSTLENNFRERKFISYVNKIISICLEGLVQWVTELWDGTNLSASHSTTWAFLFFFFFFTSSEPKSDGMRTRGEECKENLKSSGQKLLRGKISFHTNLSSLPERSSTLSVIICYMLWSFQKGTFW